MTTLFHATSEAGAAAILEGGFRASRHGLVWLASGRLTADMLTGEYSTQTCIAVTVPEGVKLVPNNYRHMPRSIYNPNPLWERRRKAAGATPCPFDFYALPVDIVNAWPRRLHDTPDVPLPDEARAKAAAFDAEHMPGWKRRRAAGQAMAERLAAGAFRKRGA